MAASKSKLTQRQNRIDHLIAIGLSSDDIDGWVYKWTSFKANVKQKGFICRLTFEEYTSKAVKDGLISPSQIGCKSLDYNLCKHGDVPGDYTKDNCTFKTHKENMQERALNGGLAAQANKMSGRRKDTHEHIQRSADSISKQYRVVDPDGTVYIGKSLRSFCFENQLDQATMSKVCRGEVKHHKGWTGRYIE